LRERIQIAETPSDEVYIDSSVLFDRWQRE